MSDVVTIIKSVSPDRQVTLVAHDWGGVSESTAGGQIVLCRKC